jgi:hypothetical protein
MNSPESPNEDSEAKSEANLKWCPECGEWKFRAQFFTDRRARDGLTSYCRPCMTVRNTASKARRKAGEPVKPRRPRRTVQSVTPYKTCPRCRQTFPLEGFAINRTRSRGIGAYCLDCHGKVVLANVEKNHGSTRNKHLKERYGLTDDAVAAMAEAQGGKCAICRVKAPEHVDHDHATGAVRGILCFTCNVGLGNFEDDPDRLELARRYLTRPTPEESAFVRARLHRIMGMGRAS